MDSCHHHGCTDGHHNVGVMVVGSRGQSPSSLQYDRPVRLQYLGTRRKMGTTMSRSTDPGTVRACINAYLCPSTSSRIIDLSIHVVSISGRRQRLRWTRYPLYLNISLELSLIHCGSFRAALPRPWSLEARLAACTDQAGA